MAPDPDKSLSRGYLGTPSEWLIGGGEMGELIRRTDWSATPFGPRERWPQAMRGVVNLILGSRFPMALLWGRELLFLYNDAYREIAGEKHPRALGRSTREIWPEVWHINEPIFSAVLEGGEAVYVEDKLFPIERRGTREGAFFTLCYSPVFGDEASTAGVLVTLVETTGRVRHQQALQRERELLARIIERIPVMIAIYDPALRSFHLNEELSRVLGWTDEDAGGGDLMTLCYPDERYREEVRRFMEAAEPGWRELVVAAKDGGEVPSAWANARLSDHTFVGIGIDLRERRRAEQAIRASEEQLRLVIDATEIGPFEYCPQTGRLEWSVHTKRHFGLPPKAKVDFDTWVRGLHPEDRARVLGAVDCALRPEGGGQFAAEYRTLGIEDGKERWISARGRVTFDAHGRAERFIGVTQDITERKRAEEALRKANERLVMSELRKNEFLAMLSHELRNPLAPIRNSVYIMERSVLAGEQASRALKVIERQVEHLTRLIDDLLDVTRISRAKTRLQREVLCLNDVVRGTSDDFRDLFRRHGIQLEVAVPARPLQTSADRTRIAQVIGNLLHNAVKFTPSGGRVWVSLEAQGGEAVIGVRDNGVGIEASLLKKLFQPFVQADSTLDRSKGGLGLGLALVAGLVELHGGSVSVKSRGPGTGAEFKVRLPLESAEEVSACHGSAQSSKGANEPLHVLLIEDNLDAAESLKLALELDGYEVETAGTGPEGIEKAHVARPDVVLCDIGLPGMDGFEVARRMRTDPELQSAPLVALSGYAAPEDLERARQAGFDEHVVKPPNLATLESTLSEVRAARRSLGAATEARPAWLPDAHSAGR